MPLYWRGSTALEEQPDSPYWEFGERVVARRIFRGPYALAKSSAPLKGVIGTGIVNGLFVAKSTVTHERGGAATLVIDYESSGGQPEQGATLPADTAFIDAQQLDLALEKHPRYSGLGTDLLVDVNTLLKTAKNDAAYTDAKTRVDASALALELFQKMRGGETHYTLWVPVYKITTHHWNAPGGLTTGGFLDSPPTVPATPPSGYDWLREADRLSFNGSTWTVESVWVAAPNWDTQIY